MTQSLQMDRRSFLKVTGTAGAGLIIQIFLPGCTTDPTATPAPTAPSLPTAIPTATIAPTPTFPPEEPASITPNILVTIGNDGLITVTVTRSEMGQGVRTALPMVLADEMGADWASIRVVQAPAGSEYGSQLTGGSQSMSVGYNLMRRAGAVARTLLIAAAAAIWEVPADECVAENSFVSHPASGQQWPFARLVTKALAVPPLDPATVKVKPNTDALRIVGTRIGRIDGPEIVTGRARYGLDTRVPDMLYATVARADVFGETVASFDDVEAKAVIGVRHVVQVSSGVAVVADNTWAALQGRRALKVIWNAGKHSELNSDSIRQKVLDQIAETPTAEPNVLEAIYEMPYFAHATMEPMNCVADVRADSCELWVPTQNPARARQRTANMLGLSEAVVKVNVTLMGGGFGRRLEGDLSLGSLPIGTDYVSEAVQISQAIGVPVQVVWTREDDIQHDIYHPMSLMRKRASLGDFKSLQSRQFFPTSPLPLGNWRGVSNVMEVFAQESFLDEYAAATGVDPLEFRLTSGPASARAVLELVAEKAGWGSALPAGQGRGLAYGAWASSKAALVAEVSVTDQGTLRVLRAVCAIDCGLAVNPDMIEAQIESGIIYGLTAALKDPITVDKGRIQQSNFHDLPLLRLDETPLIEVHIVSSKEGAMPTGVGELSNPLIMPAVANAIFAASGKRIRRLPIRATDLQA